MGQVRRRLPPTVVLANVAVPAHNYRLTGLRDRDDGIRVCYRLAVSLMAKSSDVRDMVMGSHDSEVHRAVHRSLVARAMRLQQLTSDPAQSSIRDQQAASP
jgi:hypothetical protein